MGGLTKYFIDYAKKVAGQSTPKKSKKMRYIVYFIL